MNWYLEALKKYATFSGRARRKEYWMFFLINISISIILSLSPIAIGAVGGVLYFIYVIAMIIPGLALAVRRLQDQGKEWTWIFVGLVPFIGGIWLLVLMCTEGSQGENKYGLDPKDNFSGVDVLDA